MEALSPDKRREMRFPVQPGTIIEVNHHGVPDRARTCDISFTGILLEFDHPVTLAIGDWLTLDFVRDDSNSLPLPYWGVGRIVRIEGNSVALDFDIQALVDLNWQGLREDTPDSVEAAVPTKT